MWRKNCQTQHNPYFQRKLKNLLMRISNRSWKKTIFLTGYILCSFPVLSYSWFPFYEIFCEKEDRKNIRFVKTLSRRAKLVIDVNYVNIRKLDKRGPEQFYAKNVLQIQRILSTYFRSVSKKVARFSPYLDGVKIWNVLNPKLSQNFDSFWARFRFYYTI